MQAEAHPVCISLEICLFQRKLPNKWPAWQACLPACQSSAGKVEASLRVSGTPSACGSGMSIGASYCEERDQEGEGEPPQESRATAGREVYGHQDDNPSSLGPLPPLLPYCFYLPPPPPPPTPHSVLTWQHWDRAQIPKGSSLAPASLSS